MWGKGFLRENISSDFDVCWVLIVESLLLIHFLGLLGAARRWISTHEFPLGSLMKLEHSLLFLGRIFHGVHRALLGVDLTRILLAPLGDAHRILLLPHNRTRPRRKPESRSLARRRLEVSVVPLEEFFLFDWILETVRIVLTEDHFLLLSDFAIFE